MSNRQTKLYTRRISRRRISRFFSVALAVMLIGPGSGVLHAGWLDALKEALLDDKTGEQSLSTDVIAGGLKEALRVATRTTTDRLGMTDGFNLDPQIHIPLPSQLEPVQDVLERFGMDSMLTDLEVRLNRAAEIATPKARDLFMQAIEEMTLDDVMAIYKGPDDAATQYFKSKMSAPLALEMSPVVDESLAQAGAVKLYEDVMQRYNSMPFVPQIDADIGDYVVEKGMDGVFYYLAKEEAAIRQDPAKRTTDILKQVFGN